MDVRFEYRDLIVEYDYNFGVYHVIDNLCGAPLGTFYLSEGPGWMFMTPPNRTTWFMGELPALAEFHQDLQATIDPQQ